MDDTLRRARTKKPARNKSGGSVMRGVLPIPPTDSTGLKLPPDPPALVVRVRRSVLARNAYVDAPKIAPGCEHRFGCKCDTPFWLRDPNARELLFESRYLPDSGGGETWIN
jgi:hypothetical protein